MSPRVGWSDINVMAQRGWLWLFAVKIVCTLLFLMSAVKCWMNFNKKVIYIYFIVHVCYMFYAIKPEAWCFFWGKRDVYAFGIIGCLCVCFLMYIECTLLFPNLNGWTDLFAVFCEVIFICNGSLIGFMVFTHQRALQSASFS